MNPTKLLPFASPVPPRQQDESAEVGLHAMRAEAKQAIARTCFPALGRVAFLAALVAAGQANATFFSEDFSGTSRPTTMTQAGSYATFDGVNARFNGTATNHRTYLRTSDTDYNTTDFVAEVTVTILSTGAQGLVFFGIGQGDPDAGYAYEPRNGPHTFMRPGPDNFHSGSVVLTDQGSETNEGQNKAGTGTHRLRLSWDATLSKATFAIDRNYTGGPFVADFTFGPVTGSDNGFTNLNSRIFFGGNAGSTFDDFTVVRLDGGTGFKLTITPNATTPGNYDFSWNSEDGKVYDLVSDTGLAAAPSGWDVWDSRAGIASGGTTTRLENVPGGGDPKRFFAVLEKARDTAPKMIPVQGGTLPMSMGTVTVNTFQIGKFEVTWGEWKAVRDKAARRGYDIGNIGAGCADDHPVHTVNWYDVVKWCNLKSEIEGLTPVYTLSGATYKSGQSIPAQNLAASGYRLPTEAEWEFAARGGIHSTPTTYSGSNTIGDVAWYIENSRGAACDLLSGRGAWPVGLKNANELGLHDMSGNVDEWCWDASDSSRRLRGGSWAFIASFCPVSYRSRYDPDGRRSDFGFRLARSSRN